jgi:glutamate racemase
MEPTAPIGIFDSGVGGLTVVRAVHEQLPTESVLYLGDTARVPYGTKSSEVVQRYALKCADFLKSQGAKAIVIACNTASAVAVDTIRNTFQIPVLGVIVPGAQAACEASNSGKIGVIGTQGTIESGSYQRAIKGIRPDTEIFAKACPLLVPLAEEGLLHHPATELLAKEYLEPLIAEGIDTLVLGCTHYPLLQPLLEEIAGKSITVINSAAAVATAIKTLLEENNLASTKESHSDRFFSTDTATRFKAVGKSFLGDRIDDVAVVDL